MASLLDKLRQIENKAPAERKQASEACLIVKEEFEINEILPIDIDKELFYLLSSRNIESDIKKEDIVFIDTETTGLSGGVGTLAFLIGVGRIENDKFVIKQYFMRDYDEEIYVISGYLEDMKSAKLCVSYNGASFDIPLIKNRCILNRLEYKNIEHLDILHTTRRIYKERLNNCRLKTIEEELFDIKRQGDIDGAEIPQKYFDYLKTGVFSDMEVIVSHNRLDIYSLAKLFFRLCTEHSNPNLLSFEKDIFSMAKVLEKRGKNDLAISQYRRLKGAKREAAQLQMATLYKRQKEYKTAAELLQSLPNSPKVCIELAKIFEHRFKDIDRALYIVRQGMLYCFNGPNDDKKLYEDLLKRQQRLNLKKGRD